MKLFRIEIEMFDDDLHKRYIIVNPEIMFRHVGYGSGIKDLCIRSEELVKQLENDFSNGELDP